MEEIFNNIVPIEKKNNLSILHLLLDKLSNKSQKNTDNDDLMKSLKNAQEEFDMAIKNYEFADEPELIDYYTYKIKATQTRYQYLLKKVKEKGL